MLELIEREVINREFVESLRYLPRSKQAEEILAARKQFPIPTLAKMVKWLDCGEEIAALFPTQAYRSGYFMR